MLCALALALIVYKGLIVLAPFSGCLRIIVNISTDHTSDISYFLLNKNQDHKGGRVQLIASSPGFGNTPW